MGLIGDRYRLVERLGTGGMSVVWRGYDEILGRHVAIKVLPERLSADDAVRARLRQEATAAARLCHPNITAIHDFGEVPPYVVMELIDGESLAVRLAERGPLPWRDAVTVAGEVASALAAAHSRGVVHRDVTPANVMLTAAGAKVVDFGISALVGQRDAGPDGSLLGTPAYLAPERLEGREVTTATDVYALGLLLYRALTARLPWPAENTAEALRAHLYADPEPLPSLPGMPAGVAELCLRCLAKDPAERPPSAEVAAALAAVAGTPVVVPAPVRPDPAGRPTPRVPRALAFAGRRRLQAAVASVALLAVLGVGWSAARRPVEAGPVQAAAVGGGPVAGVASRGTCRVRYQVKRDSGREFTAQLMIVNTGPRGLAGWRLAFTYAGGQRVTAGIGITQRGRSVVVLGGPGRVLDPGRAVTVTLSGEYRDTNPMPLVYALNGRSCLAEVIGATGGSAGTGDDGPSQVTEAAGAGRSGRTGGSGRTRTGTRPARPDSAPRVTPSTAPPDVPVGKSSGFSVAA